jgi:flavin reductase (DIM6/NTAB) family NADH-FMN oxidoreductase RutF
MEEISAAEAFSLFKPESCVFVISVDKAGRPNGMVAGWHTKCSMEPPLFAVCLSKKGNTNSLIRESREFVVAVPGKGLEKELLFFGSSHGDKVDKFKDSGVATGKAKCVRSPLLADATFNLECALEKEVDCGDHFLFVGRVLAAHANPGKKVLMNMGKAGGSRVFQEF